MAIAQADRCMSLLRFQQFKELQNRTRKYYKSGVGKIAAKGKLKEASDLPSPF